MFPVVFALASKLNVQLFIATHSIEAIDAILRYGNYENNNADNDPLKVITLKKIANNNGSNIVARKDNDALARVKYIAEDEREEKLLVNPSILSLIKAGFIFRKPDYSFCLLFRITPGVDEQSSGREIFKRFSNFIGRDRDMQILSCTLYPF